MAQAKQPLEILAQPKCSCRERYSSEMRDTRSRRYIRADPNPKNYEYPTVTIPATWGGRQIFIQVTLITVRTEQAPLICVHPYPIDSSDDGVRRDENINTLYFPVSREDFDKGCKSFRISRQKLTQYDLRNKSPLRLLDTNEFDQIRVQQPGDARSLIEIYQLTQSRLLFSIAEMDGQGQMIVFRCTSVCSHIMDGDTNNTTEDRAPVRYAPPTGAWSGGDEIIMVIPALDRRRPHQISFEYSPTVMNSVPTGWIIHRTIGFRTPSCAQPIAANQSLIVPIVVTQNGTEIARVPFSYQNRSDHVTNDQHLPGELTASNQVTSVDMFPVHDYSYDDDDDLLDHLR